MGPFRLATAEDKNICVTLFVKHGCISSLSIMEYGSTPYVGMAREKNGSPI